MREEEDHAVARQPNPRRVGAEAAAVGSGLFFTHDGRSSSTSPLPPRVSHPQPHPHTEAASRGGRRRRRF